MDCHSLLQGIFPTQGLNSGLLHCRQILHLLSHEGSSRTKARLCTLQREWLNRKETYFLFVKNVPMFSIIQRLLLLELCRFYRGWWHHILTHRSTTWWIMESTDRFFSESCRGFNWFSYQYFKIRIFPRKKLSITSLWRKSSFIKTGLYI